MPRESFAFWRYSLRTYRQPEVAKACLALQDACGADVNLLLYCCWMGSEGRSLGKRAVRQAMAAVGRWQREVVWPLRRARRAIRKDQHGSLAETALLLRQKIVAAELDAEYVQQRMLATVASETKAPIDNGTSREIAAANLARYFDALGVAAGPRAARHLRTLADSVAVRAATLDRTTR